MENFSLVDDGTMDTVIRCQTCKQTERFSDVERSSDPEADAETLSSLYREHTCEDVSHARLAELYHSGQSSPLYAFLSTGTVVQGLHSEILSCIRMVKLSKQYHAELSSLEEFSQWAECEEAKLFPEG